MSHNRFFKSCNGISIGNDVQTVAVKNELFIPYVKSCIDQGKSVTFRVRGYSMRPFLENDRDSVILEAINCENVKKGDVVLAEISKYRYVLHRVVERKGENLVLRGDGNVYGTERCRVTNVIAFASAFLIESKQKRKILTSAFLWRCYSFLWPDNAFLRRCLLFIFRHTIFRKHT